MRGKRELFMLIPVLSIWPLYWIGYTFITPHPFAEWYGFPLLFCLMITWMYSVKLGVTLADKQESIMELVAKVTPKRDTDESYPSEIDFEIRRGEDGQRGDVSIILSDRTLVFHADDIKKIAEFL